MTADSTLFDLPSIIEIQTTQKKGRECLASELIGPSTTILKVFPYATAIFDSFKKRICARCLAAHPTKSFSTHCVGCDQVYFCSALCASKYLVKHDQGLCELLRKLASLKKVDKHMKSVAKLIIMVYWQRHLQQQQQLDLEDDRSGSYLLVHQLESHYEDWSLEMKREWARVQSFLWKYLSSMGWLQSHETDIDIMHLASKIESNGFGIYLEKRLDTVAGRALYPLASLFNHDCTFNCQVEQWTEEGLEEEMIETTRNKLNGSVCKNDKNDNDDNGDDEQEEEIVKTFPSVFTQPRGKFRQMFISTITTVTPHQPLTIGYIDTTLPVASRRQKLLQDYYFVCKCERCVSECATIGNKKKKVKSKGSQRRMVDR